ncbi:hypothetical protein [Bacillus phage Negev_SA]|uniref:Uncharacterized protein n=1 Tax=Bacillus phage Negev_SA TaxID=1983579 RepID=A0A288WFZ5_9CAUD|nr:hypothetical protein P9C72_gp44 [Bacillus phage Negev_SA]ARW58499.1 hypothetical protein [Bacillus phage Negev_SA]
MECSVQALLFFRLQNKDFVNEFIKLSPLVKSHIYYYGLLFIILGGAPWSGALFNTDQIRILFNFYSFFCLF